MAEKAITVYSPSGKTEQISPDAWADWKAAGWSNKPTAVQAEPPKSQKEQPFTKPGFGAGFSAGVNPLHSTPELPNPGTMGKVGNGVADAFNVREIINRAQTGDVKGAVGEGLGTLSQAGATAGIGAGGKALKQVKLAERAAKEVPLLAKAAKRGSELASDLRVSPDVGRVVERYAAPLREAIDKKFDIIHKALNGKMVAIGAAPSNLIRELANTEVPAIRKLAESLMDTTLSATKQVVEQTTKESAEKMAMAEGTSTVAKKKLAKGVTETGTDAAKETATQGTGAKETTRITTKEELPLPITAHVPYEVANALKKSISSIISNARAYQAEHYVPKLMQLSEAIGKEIGNVAKANGMKDAWEGYKNSYKQVKELTNAAAGTAKVKFNKLRPMISGLVGQFGLDVGGAARMGAQLEKEIEIQISPIIEAQAKRLAKKLGVSMEELVSKPGAGEQIGGAMQNAGRAGEGTAAAGGIQRLVQSLMSKQPANEAPQVPTP